MRRVMYGMSLATCMAIFPGAILWTPQLLAQENATITGTVSDASGAVIPNAAITLTNAEAGERRSTTSNSTGTYIFTALPVGQFSVSASAPGFQRFLQSGVTLNVSDTIKIDIHLQPGLVSQSVTVEADTLHLQAETNEVSDLISGKQITQLATNGRDITSLATLGMGVSSNLPDFQSIGAPSGGGGGISFEGTRPYHDLWMIDGAEVDDRGSGGMTDVLPSPDALAEFKVLESNYSPDYGIASGGTVTMVIKSGTHDFHGGLWEFNRNDIFDANNYISKLNGQPKPELRLNIFGGNLGGPVWIPHVYKTRKKTFFFVNEEWRRLVLATNPTLVQDVAASNFPVAGQPLIYTPPSNGKVPVVPTTNDPARLALYAQDGLTIGKPFPNNTIPVNLIDPNAVLFMGTGVIPHPNAANNNFVVQTAFPTYVHEDVVRIDHDINSRFQLMSHYVHDNVQQYSQGLGTNTFTTIPEILTVPSYSGVVKLIQIYTPTLVNQTAFNYNRATRQWSYAPGAIYQQPAGWNAETFFPGNNPYKKLPEVDMGAPYNIDFTASYAPYHNAAAEYQGRDDVSWTRGRHELTFGAGFMRFTKLQNFQIETQGAYSFSPSTFSGDSYVNLLLGLAASYSQLQQAETDYWVNNTTSLYGNDNWHVNPRITLNLGIRYDALPPTYERHNRMANFVPGDYNPALAPEFNSDGSSNPNGPGFITPAGSTTPFYLNGVQLAGVNGYPRGLVKNYWGTVAPRVGFAADLFGDGKTVLRGGFGIFYERIEGGGGLYNLAANAPFAFQPSVTSVYFSNPSTSAINGQTAARPTFPAALSTLAYNYPIPSTADFSLGVQRQVSRSVIAVIQYVGTTAWHQNDLRAIDTLPLSSTERQGVAAGTYNANLARIYPGFSGIQMSENNSNSSYHSLQAGLRAENWHELTLQLSYTFSHEIDIVSNDLSAVSDPFNLEYDRGSGTFDRRHSFSANYIYTFPFFLHSQNVLARQTLGNWQFSGITVAQSGTPTAPAYSPDVLGLGGGTANRPNLVGKVRGPRTQKEYFNTAAFAPPVAPWAGGPNQGFGNAGKDSIVSPGRLNFNLALFKTFPLTSHEGPQFEFRLESFNTFNHTQFMTVNTNYTASTFGQVTAVQDPRVLQLGAKFLF
jgi:Carboxypeptidase regulatory-like domain/TonB-dependent Receptor Plug Domain